MARTLIPNIDENGNFTNPAVKARLSEMFGSGSTTPDTSALAEQVGRRLAAETSGRLSEVAPGVTIGAMVSASTASATSIGSVTFTPDPQVITVSTNHGLKVGDPVGFTGVSGVSPVNNNETYWVTEVPTATTFRLSTIKGGTSTTITGTGSATGLYRRVFAWDPATNALYAGFRVTEGRPVQSGTGYPQNRHIKPDPTVVTYAPGIITGTALRVAFDFTGDRFDILAWQGGSSSGRIIVDGLEAGGWGAATFTAAGVSAWRGRIPITFSDARRRTIEIRLNSASDIFPGIDVGNAPLPSYPLSAGPKGARWLFSGDSFTEGAGSGAGWGYTQWVAEHLGWKDLWRGGSGSTGYVQDGNRLSLGDRYQNDILAQAPDGVVLAYGINDGDAWSTNPETVKDTAATVWDAVLAEDQIKDLVIVGPFPNSGGTNVQQRYIDMDAAFKDMAATRGLKYISPISEGWTFTLADGTHPDAAGHELIGRKIAGHLSI